MVTVLRSGARTRQTGRNNRQRPEWQANPHDRALCQTKTVSCVKRGVGEGNGCTGCLRT